ncbi:MAG TPA: methyltransferase, partial [Polyangia bacterium]
MKAAVDQISREPYPAAPPGFVIRVVLALRNALLALAHALVPADVRVFELAIGIAPTKMLHVVAKHRIADHLADGPRTAAELAWRTGLDADALHRTLRALAHLGVFRLRADGRFANNRLSASLRQGRYGRLRDAAVYLGSASNVGAWNDLEETVRTGRNAFERVFGMSVWDWFDAHADERETFAQFMMGRTVFEAPTIAALYPFGELQRICDVGGGRGTLLSELLVRHPHLRGVLCDAPGVIASARELLERRGLGDRVELVAGSFFESVPAGADAYLLKNILHDWDDARSL